MPRPRSAGEGTLFGGGEITPRRRWLAIVAATVVMLLAYVPIAEGLRASLAGDPIDANFVLFGLAFVPLTYLVAAFGSKHRRAPGAVLRALGLFLLVGAPTVVFVHTIVGVVAGLGAGGIVALRAPAASGWRPRAIALTVACVYLLVLFYGLGASELAIVTGATIPLAASGIADEIVLAVGASRGDDTGGPGGTDTDGAGEGSA